MKQLAVVTGATGMVGSKIVSLLLKQGIPVRILTRNKAFIDPRVEIIYGDLENASAIEKLLDGANSLFHCAAELNDENKMWGTNVKGTQILIDKAKEFHLNYICHLSSVGVIGKFRGNCADESTDCSPMNMYEKTKLEAEKLMRNFNGNAQVVILRPTNVVDKVKHSLNLSKIKCILKGGENAHIVHAQDVASAAVYFLGKPPPKSPDCYIVSYDHEKMNTFSGCEALCIAIRTNNNPTKVKTVFHLPWQIPYALRRIKSGPCNRGDVIYSSNKLLSTGFSYPLGFIGALRDICSS